MKTYLIMTKNTETVRTLLNDYPGTELVASQLAFMVWVWHNVSDTHLAEVQGNADYLGSIELPA